MADELVCDTANGVIEDLDFILLIGYMHAHIFTQHLSQTTYSRLSLNTLIQDCSPWKTHPSMYLHVVNFASHEWILSQTGKPVWPSTHLSCIIAWTTLSRFCKNFVVFSIDSPLIGLIGIEVMSIISNTTFLSIDILADLANITHHSYIKSQEAACLLFYARN